HRSSSKDMILDVATYGVPKLRNGKIMKSFTFVLKITSPIGGKMFYAPSLYIEVFFLSCHLWKHRYKQPYMAQWPKTLKGTDSSNIIHQMSVNMAPIAMKLCQEITRLALANISHFQRNRLVAQEHGYF